MSKSEHSKDISKIFGSVKLYKDAKQDWVRIVPPELGDIKFSVQQNDHSGWLKCDGRPISRTDYADLFAIIGTSFGIGNGTSTFNLPDARSRVLGGIGQGGEDGLSLRTLGQTEGTEMHTLTVNEIPQHTHSVSNAAYRSGNDTGTTFDDVGAGELDLRDTTTITSGSTGGGQPHENMQPTLFIGNVFIFGVHQI